jgi:hypothetical protein
LPPEKRILNQNPRFFNIILLLTAILILTHPASSIYTKEETPLSRGDSPKKPITEA